MPDEEYKVFLQMTIEVLNEIEMNQNPDKELWTTMTIAKRYIHVVDHRLIRDNGCRC